MPIDTARHDVQSRTFFCALIEDSASKSAEWEAETGGRMKKYESRRIAPVKGLHLFTGRCLGTAYYLKE